MRGIKSPLTSSENVKLVREVLVTDLIEQWKHSFNMDVSKELGSHTSIFEYKCIDSGLFFFVPFDVEGSGEFYQALQQFPWYYMPEKWEHFAALKSIYGRQKILEVGCGKGGFIEMCKEAGIEVKGIELNEAAIKFAQDRGLDVTAEDLHQLADRKLKFYDCICSFQVLEHISEPKTFIHSCLKLLKPGGKLIFTVPNADTILASDYSLLDMPPHHMTRWTKQSFKSLEHIFGVRLDVVLYEPIAKYHWEWYFNLIKQRYGRNRVLKKIFALTVTKRGYHTIMAIGLNRFIKGHTIYVELTKN